MIFKSSRQYIFRLHQVTLWLLLIFFFAGCIKSKKGADHNKPNIVFILSDDQAWTDYGFMGHNHIETPNIDKLASEGLTFTRGYLTAPVCRPSLASIITGLYPHQHQVTGNDPEFSFEGERKERLQKRDSLNDAIVQEFKKHETIPALLKEQGYVSFQAGKWWEGSWEDGGFTDGMTHGDPDRGGRHGDKGLSIGRDGLQPIYDFINKAEFEDKPFFLWYAPFMPHSPHTPPDSLLQKYEDKAPTKPIAQYWAMCEWFDITVGQLLKSLDERGLTENTIVVFVGDNGWIQNPDQRNKFIWPSKQSPYDMGIRTPVIYTWPGQISSEIDTSTFVSSVDIAPTVLSAVGIEPAAELPGIDVTDREKLERRSAVFSEDFHHDITDVQQPSQSLEHRMIMKNPWKLIIPAVKNQSQSLNVGGGGEFIPIIEKPELYNIVNDPYEKRNVISEHPEIVKELRQELNSWWNSEL